MNEFQYLASAIIQATAISYGVVIAVGAYLRQEHNRNVDILEKMKKDKSLSENERAKIEKSQREAKDWQKRFFKFLVFSTVFATLTVGLGILALWSRFLDLVHVVAFFSLITFSFLSFTTYSVLRGPLSSP